MTENLFDSHLKSFADHLNEQYGERGTPAREEFEEGFEAFKQSLQEVNEKKSSIKR